MTGRKNESLDRQTGSRAQDADWLARNIGIVIQERKKLDDGRMPS